MGDPKELTKFTVQLENEIKNDKFAYGQLYRKIYKFYLLGNKSLSIEYGVAEDLWKCYLKPVMHLYPQFLNYLSCKTIKPHRVHKDLWIMVYEFATTVTDFNKVS